MLAARTVAKEKVEYVQLPEPVPGPGEVLVRARHVTLCGTDLHIWEDEYATELPIIQGHEFAGVIESLGPPGPSPDPYGDWAPGDAVVVFPAFGCGSCYACEVGRGNACADLSVYGCYTDGALTELIPVPAEKLHRVPAWLPLELASLTEPTSIALQAVRRGRSRAGETALVLGCGPIGLLVTLCLTELGVEVIAADTDAGRARFALTFGAGEALTVGTDGFPDAAQAKLLATAMDGRGVPLVFEAAGVPASMEAALDVVSNAGRVVAVGISDRAAVLPMRTIPAKEIDLIGSRNSVDLFDEALDVLGRHPGEAAALVTHRFALRSLAEAFSTMRARDGMVGKIAIDLPEPAA